MVSDCKEIQPVHPKGDQSWVFVGGTDAEAETPILWPPDAKSWLIWKDPDSGKDCGQEEKGTTDDERVGWHHRLDEHEFGWTQGAGDGQGGLPGGLRFMGSQSQTRLSDWTDWLTEWSFYLHFSCGGVIEHLLCLRAMRTSFSVNCFLISWNHFSSWLLGLSLLICRKFFKWVD